MSTEHNHAIIIIKNEEGEYLQYYDNRWNSYLFLNLKMTSEFNENYIKAEISKKLEIPTDHINVKYLMDKRHKKFSESAKIEKEYHHYFYLIDIGEITNETKHKQFIINEIQYKWFSKSELESDERIQEVNSDVVGYVLGGETYER